MSRLQVLLLLLQCFLHEVIPDWKVGRATYYGGPSTLSNTYDPARGKGSFGILPYGSCGYTNSDGSMPFPKDAIAALADEDDDYPGSCGRCYEVKCVTGVVQENPNKTIHIINGTFNGDKYRPYLASISSSYKDTYGRSWPGNPDEKEGLLYTKCWDQDKALRIRIVDSCPCIQVLPDGAPGVKKGGEVRRQEWCCGGEHHFDLSYYAFEELAHPVYGAMMLKYRPVDCVSGAELPSSPGYVSKTIFKDVPQPGWAWFPYKPLSTQVSVPGVAPDGSGATCVSVEGGGGLSFRCRDCYKPGYQPFAGASSVKFWIKQNDGSFIDQITPEVPQLKVFVYNQEKNQYCKREQILANYLEQAGSWFRFTLPMSGFECGGGSVSQNLLTAIAFQDVSGTISSFCVADLVITT
ncbi:hypothetical protein CEUSTIGMA_g6850.t1 [Chlamydomonas eustigma]|uniref:Expansin-like EG45 domain-containing protein n=1 Tax=Chlamydomonas eustigma TaxID=1157962 RepID=A0A250X919_9CHLO|nr:hypothetical protein CEUSTIGMA_g6850.t1 [Chlamydomonas eustigma]|eukprot:GAX79409.1 hypothetical protein CEUSTIGMA_g6850.t1 [Chlamydomonas eustigma]